MKVAVFGGTFNPVHLAHIQMAQAVVSREDVDKLLIIPAKLPPHKKCEFLAGENERFEMCRLAFSSFEKTEILDIEFQREGPSYTVDTLSQLNKPGVSLMLVCGGDMIETFDKWREYEKILKIAEILAFKRVGVESVAFENGIANIVKSGGTVITADVTVEPMSSTNIRERIKNGDSIENFVPKSVAQYIAENGLYR